MQTKEVKVKNRAGMHARPATLIVNKAEKFESKISLEKDGYSVNAKSIMAVITLGANYNSTVIIKAEGPDELQAVEEIAFLFDNRFEEE